MKQPIDEFIDQVDSNCQVLSKSLSDSPLSLLQALSEQRGKLIQYRVSLDKPLPIVHKMFDLDAKIEKTISILMVDIRKNYGKV
jgi:hypothetical protein